MMGQKGSCQVKEAKHFEEILSQDALSFIASLHSEFSTRRLELLNRRRDRQDQWNQGGYPDFLKETLNVRESHWVVSPCPSDLEDRRVEITGPVERKMMVNALNSQAKAFMADFEDSLSPTWDNVLSGQKNLKDAVRRTLGFVSPEGKKYELNKDLATLLVRPRGLHLNEHHCLIEGTAVSASFFDFGLYFFHNAEELLKRRSGPYFYLPKLESYLEARLWNDVFQFSEKVLNIQKGSIRATVLIETLPAAFEMDEILFELKNYASGLNAGRWDYMFSVIKKFQKKTDFLLPDRGQVTMEAPFMRAYTELLVKTCHRRGAHAMGGMAAFIPSRKDSDVNRVALQKVKEDKERESKDGFDGTWVAHPDLVPIAMTAFNEKLGRNPHQKNRLREEVNVRQIDLLNFKIAGGKITEKGIRNNVSVVLQYLESWFKGVGAQAIFNLMEDAATAEISRSQLWQWLWNGAKLDDGRPFTKELYQKICAEEKSQLNGSPNDTKASRLLDELVLSQNFTEFLTFKAYEILTRESAS